MIKYLNKVRVVRWASATSTESFIITQLDEPPSPRTHKAFNFTRRLRVGYNSIIRHHPVAVKYSGSSLLVALFGMGMYMHVHAVAPQSAAESDRIAFAVSNYIQLDTLQPASEASDFSTVAFAGQNVGGLPTNEAAIRQYVVQDKDTLSSIASKYSLHSGSLVLANKGTLDNTELIHPGQVLFIPDTDAAAKDLAAELTSRQQKKLAATKVASTATAKVESVKKTSSTTLAETSSADITLGQPLAYYTYISQGFNALTHPGFDFATDSGTPVFAVSKGCVETASYGYNGGYGNTLVYSMTHTNYTFRYAHLSKLLASEGDCFEQGDLLGYSGNSGRSTGPHLHFEVRYNGTAVNPGKFKL